MAHTLTDGEREVLAEQNADAYDEYGQYWAGDKVQCGGCGWSCNPAYPCPQCQAEEFAEQIFTEAFRAVGIEPEPIQPSDGEYPF
jgi:hypothetical protein